MKKGGPKAAPLPSRFTAGHAPRRHRGELSWIGAHAAQADRRSYHATVVSQWSRALTSSTTIQIRANKKGDRSRPLACAIVELRRSGDLKQRLQDLRSLLVLVERAQLHGEQRSGPEGCVVGPGCVEGGPQEAPA
jgi:hypothetical protein